MVAFYFVHILAPRVLGFVAGSPALGFATRPDPAAISRGVRGVDLRAWSAGGLVVASALLVALWAAGAVAVALYGIFGPAH
jgi:hypothetical protein